MDASGAGGLTAGLDERAAAALRTAGLRVTRPRLAVHRALAQLGGHRTADEVTAALAGAGDALPRTSVYNALEALRAVGLVMQAGTGAGAALYEVAARWHHHFVCRRCGEIADVPCAIGATPCLHPQLTGVDVDEAEVIYRGLCARCRDRR
ncbi:MAG: Fur family transcriptional regulator [Acidimicrobiia bacterium]